MEHTEPLPAKRTRKPINYRDMEDDLDDAIRESMKQPKKQPNTHSRKGRRIAPIVHEEVDYDGAGLEDDEDLDALDVEQLRAEIDKVKGQITQLEEELQRDPEGGKDAEGGQADDGIEYEVFEVPEHCVPIRTDVLAFNWDALAKEMQFDVIVMDPPWQVAGALPTRGVALGYRTLPNNAIRELPIGKLQKNGFLFLWVVNSRYNFALECLEHWGYDLVDDITWVKHTVHRRFAKGHGFYLQHAKESCLVGKKGKDPPGMVGNVCSDVIYSERRGQSQKPEQVYEIIEQLVPNGNYLEIFARRNNLRNYWVSIGLEL